MPKLGKRLRDRSSAHDAGRDVRSRYEISDEFIDEVRESTLPKEIVRLLERRAARSKGIGSAPESKVA